MALIHSKTIFDKNKSNLNFDVFQEEFSRNKILTISHGDLYVNNIINVGIEQYYLDFETFGFGHPARDLSLLLFNEFDKREEIVKRYKDKITFNYSELGEDINLYYRARLEKIRDGLAKDIHFPKKFRDKYLLQVKNQLNILRK